MLVGHKHPLSLALVAVYTTPAVPEEEDIFTASQKYQYNFTMRIIGVNVDILCLFYNKLLFDKIKKINVRRKTRYSPILTQYIN